MLNLISIVPYSLFIINILIMYCVIYTMYKKTPFSSLPSLIKNFIFISFLCITIQSVLLGFAIHYDKLNKNENTDKYNGTVIGISIGVILITVVFGYISYKTYFN